jgi:hypothetical protein
MPQAPDQFERSRPVCRCCGTGPSLPGVVDAFDGVARPGSGHARRRLGDLAAVRLPPVPEVGQDARHPAPACDPRAGWALTLASTETPFGGVSVFWYGGGDVETAGRLIAVRSARGLVGVLGDPGRVPIRLSSQIIVLQQLVVGPGCTSVTLAVLRGLPVVGITVTNQTGGIQPGRVERSVAAFEFWTQCGEVGGVAGVAEVLDRDDRRVGGVGPRVVERSAAAGSRPRLVSRPATGLQVLDAVDGALDVGDAAWCRSGQQRDRDR